MTVGTFTPFVDLHPPSGITGSANLYADSSFELQTAAWSVSGDYDGSRFLHLDGAGVDSLKITADTTNPGTAAFVSIPVSLDPTEDVWVSYDVWVPPGSGFIGKAVSTRLGLSGTGVTLVEGKQRLTLFRTAAQIAAEDAGGDVEFSLAYATNVTGLNGQHFFIDQVCVSQTDDSYEWVPADGDPYYTVGQSWRVTSTGNYAGWSLGPGDLLEVVSPGVGLDAGFHLTMLITSVEQAVAQKPNPYRGHPIGVGDWRLVVEALLPSPGAALWDVAKWDEGLWGELEWADLSPDVRGIEWTRGADEYLGRPRIGEATVTLDNLEGQWSPWNPSPPVGSAAYFAPGTLIRCAVVSATDERADGWLPQFCVIVDTWAEASAGVGADRWVTITGYETLRDLSGIDDNALPGVIGGGETPQARFERLLEASGWQYGTKFDLIGLEDITSTWTWSDFVLQSTDLANNRLTECYLTADSSDTTFRSSRKGEALVHNNQEDVGGYTQDHDPEVWPLVAFSWRLNAFAYDEPVIQLQATETLQVGTQWRLVYDADSFRTVSDDEHIVNDARFSRAEGTQQIHEQPASIARYGRRTNSRSDLLNTTDAAVLELAERHTRRRALNSLRVEEMTVATSDRGDEPYLATLAADIGVAAVVYPPSYEVGGPTLAGYLESMTHRVTPRSNGSVTWESVLGVGTRNIEGGLSAQPT